jgi:flagellar hook-length control protein FliK
MAMNPTSVPTRPATASASSAASALSASRAAANARSDPDDDGGFAAELQRAEAPPEKAPTRDPSPKASQDDAAKPGDKTDPADKDDKSVKAASHGDAAAAAVPAAVDPTALQLLQQQMAAAGMTTRSAASNAAPADLAKGIEALRKGALSAKDAKGLAVDTSALSSTASTLGNAKAGLGKDASETAGDALAGLGQGLGAGNSATDTRDSLAALLPGADATPVQAGAVGANPNAPLDAEAQAAQASTPAQATLTMPPQSAAFAPALGHQIEVWMRDGIQHAEVQLTPQELGPIRVQIAVDGTDTRVALHADVASTREALQQALPQLSDALGQAGLTLTGGGVSDQSTSQSQGQFSFGEGGGSGRDGAGSGSRGSPGGGDDGLGALAGGARPPSTPRGLVDAYA